MKNMNEVTKPKEGDSGSLPKKEEVSSAAAAKQNMETGRSEKRQALEIVRKEVAEAAEYLSEIIGVEVRPPGIQIWNSFGGDSKYYALFKGVSPKMIILSFEEKCAGAVHELYHQQRFTIGGVSKDSSAAVLLVLELKNDTVIDRIVGYDLARMTRSALDEGGARLFEASFYQKLDSNKDNFIAGYCGFNFELMHLTLKNMNDLYSKVNKPKEIGIDGHMNLGEFAKGFLESCPTAGVYFNRVGDILALSLYYINNRDANKTIKELFENPLQDSLDHIVRGIEEDRKCKKILVMIKEDEKQIIKLEEQCHSAEGLYGTLKAKRR
jgi:hypothetical protein